MSNDALSGDEIDDLLSKIEEESKEEFTADEEADQGPIIKIYDYTRPDIFTNSAIRDIQVKIEKQLSEAAEKISAVSGSEFSFKIESLDVISLDEMLRSTPNPCNMIKFILKTERFLLLTADTAFSGILSNIYLGLPANTNIENKWNSLNTEILLLLVELLYSGNDDKISELRPLKEPMEVYPESLLEPVLAVRIISNHEGSFDLTLPLTTVIELFPEAMRNFRLPCLPYERWEIQDLETTPDLWFQRQIRFPVYHASYNNMKAVFETGSLTMSPELKGKVGYETN